MKKFQRILKLNYERKKLLDKDLDMFYALFFLTNLLDKIITKNKNISKIPTNQRMK